MTRLEELRNKVNNARKTPINRKEVIDIIKDFAGDEFESKEDLWKIAIKTNGQLVGEIDNILAYFERITN